MSPNNEDEGVEIKLRVKEAALRDVGKGIVRIPIRCLKKLGLSPDDIIEVERDKRTYVIAKAARTEDERFNYIRMDGTIRTNCDARIDEIVSVRAPREVEVAQSVFLAPTGQFVIRAAENFFRGALSGRPVSQGDVFRLKLMGRKIEYMVEKTEPDRENLLITDATELILSTEKPDKLKKTEKYRVRQTYEDIGGLREEIKRIREMIELPMRYPELFHKLGVSPPKGLLLYGASGTGKTLLAKAVANETEANFLPINGPEIMSKYLGESEKKLREIFRDAQKNSPAIIFIDEIDSIAPRRRDDTGEVERRLVAQLLSLLDEMEEKGVVVIGATNQVNSIDPALRRPGRFDREIELSVPNKKQRMEILLVHARNMPLANDVNLKKLADLSHGFVGADIASLAKEAAMRSLRRIFPEIQWKDKGITLPPGIFKNLEVTMEDFSSALFDIEPSAMREVYVEIPDVTWNDTGGLGKQIKILRELVEWPIKYSYLFEKSNSQPPRGILLFGAPGTGKTLLVKALSNETQLNLIAIKGSEILSKWVGESSRAIRETFRKAKQASPCIVFFDELDALAPSRSSGDTTGVSDRVVSALLTEIDGIEDLSDVFVIAATNRPELIDTALTRAGRFDKLVYVPLPDKEARREILDVHLRLKPISKDFDMEDLVGLTEGYSGADLAAICREATMDTIRSFINEKLDGGNSDVVQNELEDLLEKTDFRITSTSIKNAIKRHGSPVRGDKSIYSSSLEYAREHGLEVM